MNTENILIVDDNDTNAKLLTILLKMEGYQSSSVNNGPTALEIAAETLPDLILLDINMPEMNGFEVCNRLQENPLTRDIPVMFISAMDEPSFIVQALEMGGVDYIVRPFDTREVAARIRKHLRMHQERLKIEKTLHEETAVLSNLTEMLQSTSYNFRDSLSGIKIAVYLLSKTEGLTAEQRQSYLERIDQNSEQITLLIEQLRKQVQADFSVEQSNLLADVR